MRHFDTFTACAVIEGLCGPVTEVGLIRAFQALVDANSVGMLPAIEQQICQRLIQAGRLTS